MVDYICHHGVKGMKWGVRRYQNKDGTRTPEGKEMRVYRDRAIRAARTKKDMDTLFNKLSPDDKHLTGSDRDAKEWLKFEEGEYVVKRFLSKYGDEPIAAMDIMTTTKNGHLTIAIMTDPNRRGSGEATRLAKKGVDWFNKNSSKYGFTNLEWSAYKNNKPSNRIAEKVGFKYNKRASDDEWNVYDYKAKNKGGHV